MHRSAVTIALVGFFPLAACALSAQKEADLKACIAYAPAFEVTERFITTFNTKNAEQWGETFIFPSVRIASGQTVIIKSAADLEDRFSQLEATGWDHTAWANREVVQCEATKAHMLTTFVRYRKDGSVLSRFNSLYVIEQRNGKWGITLRSSFAP